MAATLPRRAAAGRRSAEEVFGRGAQERGGAGPVVVRRKDVAVQAGDDDDRLARVLAAHEVGGAGDLVGERDPGRLQLAAAAVGPAAPVLERGDPGRADRDVRLAVAPRAAE